VEVRLNIDDAFIKGLEEKVGRPLNANDLIRDALTMFNWAIQDVASGRVIVSTNAAGEDVHRLTMPTLYQVENRAKKRTDVPAEEVTVSPLTSFHP
jgi:hypothetical protein